MIYTITFNPAIDYVIHTDKINIGTLNRTKNEKIYFGGKGINVSLVLNELGIKSKILGFVAGFTGLAIENGISEKGIESDFVHLKNGFSRINVKIKSGSETELNAQGPVIDNNALNKLFKKLEKLSDGDILILAGSVPASMPTNTYEKILEFLSNKKIKIIVDADKDLLISVLKFNPFLIKPNKHELEELFGITLHDINQIIEYAHRLKDMGAQNVLISMAGDGALLLDVNDKIHLCKACLGKVKNSVGAGDSMVAGFIAGFEHGNYEYALRLGNAAGGATAFSDGLAKKDDIYKLLKQL